MCNIKVIGLLGKCTESRTTGSEFFLRYMDNPSDLSLAVKVGFAIRTQIPSTVFTQVDKCGCLMEANKWVCSVEWDKDTVIDFTVFVV